MESLHQEVAPEGRREFRRVAAAARPFCPAQHDAERRRRRALPERRLLWIAAVATIWALLIAARLLHLQVFEHKTYRQAADRQQITTIEVPAPRGTIVDRNNRPLAISLPSQTVAINPRLIPDPKMAARLLGHVLAMDQRALLAKIESARRARRGFLSVKRRISDEEAERLKGLGVDWIELRRESKRIYPNKGLAAHVLGGVDDAEQGNFGIELGLNSTLSGVPGLERVVRDVRGRPVQSSLEADPRPGDRLTLTIDQSIQFVAETALRAAAEKYGCWHGSVVVLKAGTNEILALANYPSYDPNEKAGPDLSSRTNHAVSSPIEPGSVFKTVTVAGGIDSGRVTPGTPINCHNGAFRMFGRVIHEARHGYGVLPVSAVYAKSSNIGAIQVALRLGDTAFHKYIRAFGLGAVTGVPLPGESPGRVWPAESWQKTSIASIAMGHEVSATPLQLAAAASVLANGGVWIRPKLVLRRERADGRVVPQPAGAPRRVVSPETAIEMRKLMEEVVLHGTGGAARLEGYTSGGKTGSAQIYDFKKRRYTSLYNASFMGLAPVPNPAIVVMVSLSGSPKFGGVVAAPVFREVAQAALRILEVPRDIPDGIAEPSIPGPEDNAADLAMAGLGDRVPELEDPPGAPAPTAGGRLAGAGPRAPDFRGKSRRAVVEEATAAGLAVELAGNGIARAQAPAPGSVLAPGETIRVHFSR